MRIKIAEIVPFSRAAKALFDAHKGPVIAYDDSLSDPFETETWEVQIEAANDIVGTQTSILLNKSKTAAMRA